MKYFKKCIRSNLKFAIALGALYSELFAQQSCSLHLTSGDHIECSTFKQVFTSRLHYYLCDGDTIQPEAIIGMTDTAGYHPYFKNAFLFRMIPGKFSIYSGDVPSLEISSTSGINSGLTVEPVVHKKSFIPLTIIFYEFQPFRANIPIEEAFKSYPDASRLYSRYKLSNVISIAGLGISMIPLIGGLFALSDHRTEKGLVLLITSGAGVTISTAIRGIIGKQYLNRSIERYNKI